MYRTSHQIRILGAAFAAVFGLGVVATAGGALQEERTASSVEGLQLVKLEPIVVRLHPSPHVAAACEQAPKTTL